MFDRNRLLGLFLFFSLLGIGLYGPGVDFNPYESSRLVFSQEGSLLRMTLSKDEKYRVWIPLEQIPENIQKVFLDKEDQYFYYHPGFNPWSLGRSFIFSYLLKRYHSGGSTITMQLARLHHGLNTRTIAGKFTQILYALKLELFYTKDSILEAYLNLIPFGRNIEGVAAASRIYFQKSLKETLVPEQYFLTHIPQRPGPLHSHQSFSKAPNSLMKAYNRTVRNVPNFPEHYRDYPIFLFGIKDLPFESPHWTDYILREKRGTVLNTTLNLSTQKIIESTIKSYLNRNAKRNINNAAALLIDFRTGKVKSLIGSGDFFNNEISGQVNGAIAPRSPGSLLKPFIYALSFEQGQSIPKTILFDAPLPFKTPENFDQEYMGPVSAEQALILSRNVPAVDLASRLRSPNFYEFLKNLFPTRLNSKNIYGTSLTLGGVEFSMMEITRLYMALAKGGEMNEILELKDETQGLGMSILKEHSNAMVMDILGKNPRPGTQYEGRNYLVSKEDVFWKTGTSFGFRDAWSVGIFGQYVLAVWIGNFSGSGNPHFVGGRVAAPLFFEIFDKLKEKIDPAFRPLHRYSSNLREVHVCALSGHLPTKHCPHKVTGLFIPGVSSIKKCTIHRKMELSQRTGLRTCSHSKGKTFEKVVEVWPSQVLKIFKNLGLPRKLPPAYSPECKISDFVIKGDDPQIISPKIGLKYTYRPKKKNILPLKAHVDSDVGKLFWYLGKQYLGSTSPDKSFFWESRPGQHLVRVVDDRGRESTRSLRVISLKQ